MKIHRWATAIVFATLASMGGDAQAVFVGGDSINPSTSLGAVGTFTIDKIADGITSDSSPFNGFVSNFSAGTIKLDLVGTFNLTDFVLWNDVNVLNEGIKNFHLDYFDAADAPLGSSANFVGPNGQVSPATYSLGTVNGVSRVDLVVIDTNVGAFTRIEIREVGFEGSLVPEPAAIVLVAIGVFGALRVRFPRNR